MIDNEILNQISLEVQRECKICDFKYNPKICQSCPTHCVELFIRYIRHISLPCKVGDEVWAIRTYGNAKKLPVKGKVSEMYYIDEAMTLCVVVKGVCRGEWGKSVFPSREAADEFLSKREGKSK